jgi:hypothetical protein
MQVVRRSLEARARISQIKQKRRQKRAQEDGGDMEDSFDTTQRYNIAVVTKETEDLLEWLYSNRDDVATKVFPSTIKTSLHADNLFRTLFQDSRITY